MDIATLLGLFLGWGALIVCLYMEGGGLGQMVNLPAFILVVVGTIGATMVGYDFNTIKCIPKILKNAMTTRLPDPNQLVDTVVGMARIARNKGILALDDMSEDLDNKFLRRGIQLVVDGTSSVLIREVLETEIDALHDRHKVGESFFTALGGFSPTLGIIGTVLGLINMLSKLNEPSKMGHAIAGAFIATLYGVAFANLFYLPISAKLKTRTAHEVLIQEMVLEGILSIQCGENPRSVEDRMVSFLSPEMKLKRLSQSYNYNEDSRAA